MRDRDVRFSSVYVEELDMMFTHRSKYTSHQNGSGLQELKKKLRMFFCVWQVAEHHGKESYYME